MSLRQDEIVSRAGQNGFAGRIWPTSRILEHPALTIIFRVTYFAEQCSKLKMQSIVRYIQLTLWVCTNLQPITDKYKR